MIDLDGLKILVVDDDRFMRTTIRAVLRAAGHFVIGEADDGDTALDAVEQFRPDFVLCDVTMPRIGGLSFVDRLRRHPDAALGLTPVIMLTGHAEQTTVLAAARLQVDGYLIKPVSPKQVSDLLKNVISRRRTIPL
jgi:two-component system chemotaxis response regulator CheY